MESEGCGGPSPARFPAAEEWRDYTVARSVRYVHLQVNDPISDANYPVAPLGLSDKVFLIAVPQRFVPWRPPALVRLADGDTAAPSGDDASVAVSAVALAAEAALLLEPASGYTMNWGGDQRWPARADLRTTDYGPATMLRDGVNLAKVTSGPPPTEVSFSPADFDTLFAGALNAGPWTGLLAMPWPPSEPGRGRCRWPTLGSGPTGQRTSSSPPPTRQ